MYIQSLEIQYNPVLSIFDQLLKENLFFKSNLYNNTTEYINFNIENFSKIENNNFNIFEFKKIYGRENLMYMVTFYIFEKTNLLKFLSLEKFEKFISKTRKKYQIIPFHNVI